MTPRHRHCALLLLVLATATLLLYSQFRLSFLHQQRHQQATTAAANPSPIHSSPSPECPSECQAPAALTRRFGVVRGYDRATCCARHAVLHDMLHALFSFLDADGAGWMLDGGTLLGNVRHRGTMVPWDTDADIGAAANVPRGLPRAAHALQPVPGFAPTMMSRMAGIH